MNDAYLRGMRVHPHAFLVVIAACAALILPGAALAKKSPKAAKAAPAPAEEVGGVESVYYALQDLSAKFTQTTEVALVGRTVTKTGTIRFKKGGMWRIDYEGKDGKSYISDGTTLWIFIPGDDASLQTFRVDDETVPKEALSFLSGFGRLRKEFDVTESGLFPDAPAGSTAVHLVPRSGTRHYESLDALFGPDRLLARLVVKNASGNVSRYTFSGVKTNAGLPDRIFSLSSGKATPDTLPQ